MTERKAGRAPRLRLGPLFWLEAILVQLSGGREMTAATAAQLAEYARGGQS